MIGIYKITNKTNKKSYIGQSIHCGQRLEQHYSGHSSQFIDDIIQVEGIDTFTFEIIKKVSPEELSYWEDYYIIKYNTYFPDGYNKKWNTQEKIRQAIKIKVEEDTKKELENVIGKKDLILLDEKEICYIFNRFLFEIYLRIYFLSYKNKEEHMIENRKITGTYLQQFFPDISYNTLMKYIKILKDKQVLIKEEKITKVKDIYNITKYISEQEFLLAKNNIIYLWYIKYKIAKEKINCFYASDFSWVFSLNSFGTHDGTGKQTCKSRTIIENLNEMGLIKIKKHTTYGHKYEIVLI